jgi:pimeloyl-ACP methyl ester carboxylesterase
MEQLSIEGEELITLRDGRTLAFVRGGNPVSKKVLIFLHGVFGVGENNPHMSKFYASLNVRSLTPTLPGWGRSSPFPAAAPLSAYAEDIRQLLDFALGGDKATHIIIIGGSYGSVWAYACAANNPPDQGMKIEPKEAICSLVTLGSLTPHRENPTYTENMTWMNWFTVSRPATYWPLSLIHSSMGKLIRSKVAGNLDGARGILRQILTGPKAMLPEERDKISEWTAQFGSTFEQWEDNMARNMSLSVLHTMDGWNRVPETLNSDWGFHLADIKVPLKADSDPAQLLSPTLTDIPAKLPPVVIVGCVRDHLSPITNQRFVASKIAGAQLIELPGNHISAVVSLRPLIAAVVAGIPE